MLDHQLAGLSFLPIVLFGSLFNWIVVLIILKENLLNSPFMFLTFIKSFCDALHLTFSLIHTVPMVILADKFLISLSPYVGYFLIVMFEISIYTHFITSFSRFSAVFTPISYQQLFSSKNTQRYVLIAAIIAVTDISVVNFIFGCYIKYDPDSWVYFYNTEIPICNWYVMYADFMKNLCLVFVDFGIDIVTLLKVQRMRRQFRSGKRSENYTKKETDFLKQCCGQGFCYLMGYTSYLMVPEMNTNKYVAFFMSVMSWCAIAMIDGLFTIVYNCEIRTKLIKEKSEISVVSVTGPRKKTVSFAK